MRFRFLPVDDNGVSGGAGASEYVRTGGSLLGVPGADTCSDGSGEQITVLLCFLIFAGNGDSSSDKGC